MNIAGMERWWRLSVLGLAATSLSAGSPKEPSKFAAQQQTKPAHQPALVKKQPFATGGEQRGCPGTRAPRLPCEALTAEATMRQADIAADQSRTAFWNTWVGLLTALVAGIAAAFAARAAGAATKSYKAFIAAEDAHLVIEFTNGTWVESLVEGVRQPSSFHLTAVITNIGRSTARVHDCTVRTQMTEVDKTLRRDESETLGWRIHLESLDPFKMVVRYTSPIRTNAMLIVSAIPRQVDGKARLIADVVSTYIVDDD